MSRSKDPCASRVEVVRLPKQRSFRYSCAVDLVKSQLAIRLNCWRWPLPKVQKSNPLA